jgi:molecular chaperone IbpA
MNNNQYEDYNNWKKGKYPSPYESKPYVGDPYPHPHPIDKWQKPVPPKPATIADLFPRIDRWGIGWSPLLEQLKQISNEKPSYPPYDIVDHEADTTVVSIAVAGFAKDELEITVVEGTLKVDGKKKVKKEVGDVVYQGIASRDFTLTFALAEYYEVKEADLKDGMLTIILHKEVPEEKKPKVIDIN